VSDKEEAFCWCLRSEYFKSAREVKREEVLPGLIRITEEIRIPEEHGKAKDLVLQQVRWELNDFRVGGIYNDGFRRWKIINVIPPRIYGKSRKKTPPATLLACPWTLTLQDGDLIIKRTIRFVDLANYLEEHFEHGVKDKEARRRAGRMRWEGEDTIAPVVHRWTEKAWRAGIQDPKEILEEVVWPHVKNHKGIDYDARLEAPYLTTKEREKLQQERRSLRRETMRHIKNILSKLSGHPRR